MGQDMEEPKNDIENAIEKIEQPNQPEVEEIRAVARTFDMTMSAEVGDLAGALAKAQGMMVNGSKEKEGYGYKYMELGSLIEIARPALSKNDISCVQSHEYIKYEEKPAVVTHTLLMHKSGQWIKNSLVLPITVMKQLTAAQMIGVASTYGRRYALQAVCLIASEDDTDGTTK